MKLRFIATVEDPTQKYNVHLELPDDETGRSRIGEALTEIQQRFVPQGEAPKKPAPRATAPPRPAHQTTGGEANRDK
ncbi:MAG: hypothetical protein M3P06_05175 [Acidobacteriota bacterium]|nr:hypothetical protein [Acidobacteriota bacterium]